MTSESDKTELPFSMVRNFFRADYKNGQLTIVFQDAAHLADAWEFARKNNKLVEFERAIMCLVSVALGDAVPRKEFDWKDGTTSPGREGKDVKLTIHPDSHTEPSFAWYEEKGMVGGLIWHHRAGEWSIHT